MTNILIIVNIILVIIGFVTKDAFVFVLAYLSLIVNIATKHLTK